MLLSLVNSLVNVFEFKIGKFLKVGGDVMRDWFREFFLGVF